MNIIIHEDEDIRHYLRFINRYPVECILYKKLSKIESDYNDLAKSKGYRSCADYLINNEDELNKFLDSVLNGCVDVKRTSVEVSISTKGGKNG